MNIDYRHNDMFLEADKMIGEQQIKESLNLLLQIIEEQPDYGRAHNHLGWLYENKLKYFDLVEHHYKAAINFSPDYPAVWLNYAYFLSNMQRYDELENHLSNCLNIPGVFSPYIYNEFGIMHEMNEEYDQAIEFYVKAIRKTLSMKDIEGYEESVERCKKKKESY